MCVVVLVGAGRTGSQALAALGAQQGQLGATRLALQATGAGGAGRLAGCGGGRRRRAGDAVKSSRSLLTSEAFLDAITRKTLPLIRTERPG